MNEESLFAAAMERPIGAGRDAFLDRICGEDADLLGRVRRLLAAHERTIGILDRPVTPPGSAGPSRFGAIEAAERPGLAIAGRYVLLERIGEGGMGTVWLAEQTEPVRRKVALKLVKAGMDSASVLARFEAERQTLALMDHPNVAKVLDGGETAEGRPFFVMEHVEGAPITTHCDAARLSIRERLDLFVMVCRAVQHAHTKGIIHRDLKPSNVLVTRNDGEAAPKVIDFGVAKAAEAGPDARSTLTRDGQLIGTPLYMSPEQAELGGLAVDTRSDVYSLGVLLYELLTGSTPFERTGRGDAAFHEMLRAIREEEPETPSRRLATTLELSRIADLRKTEPARLGGLLKGDLDWIVMKALEKDRDHRYQSANSLATDLRRYLADEVVLARPPGTLHRLRKLVRRNKGKVAAAAALAVSLAVGLGGTVTAWTRARAERAARSARADAGVAASLREARAEVVEAWRASEFPSDMKRASEAARSAIRRAEGSIDGAPLSVATRVDLERARAEVDDLARHARLLVDHDDARTRFADRLTGVNAFTARVEIRDRLRDALARFGFDPAAGDPETLARFVVEDPLREDVVAILLEWHFHAAAVRDARRANPKLRAVPPDEGPDLTDRLLAVIRSARIRLGGAYARWQALVDRADADGLAAFSATPEARSLNSGPAMALGRDLTQRERNDAARVYLGAVADRRPREVWLRNDLFVACSGMRPPRHAEALRHIAVAADLRPESALFQYHLANCFMALGASEPGIAAYRRSIELCPESTIAMQGLARALLATNDPAGAEAVFHDLIRLDPKNPLLLVDHGAALGGLGRHAEARRELRAALDSFAGRLTDSRDSTRYGAICFALNLADGKLGGAPTEADRAEYRKLALQLFETHRELLAKHAKEDLGRKIRLWTEDEDLASVRDPGALDMLPPAERDAWRRFWDEVRRGSDASR